MTEHRPNAEAMLARIKEQERARLRIYIGAAPGVGKTYAMLQEAHALNARGLDVVIGLVETYGRRDTEAQLKDLEVIPAPQDRLSRRRDRRDGRRRHLCAQAAGLRRRRVAHTNVPGSRNEKRYQDVLELLDAGIHVMTAVNIQHLETLNDAVAQGRPACASAKRCRTRFSIAPTKSSTSTSRSRNCGIACGDGKIYRPEKVEQALSNFFRKGNLSTLRELALRAVADEVGEKAASYREREGLDRR